MAELTRAEVLEKAKDLGIEHNKNAKTTKILQMIEDLTGEAHETKVEKVVTKKDTVRCIIHSNDRENDIHSVEGSANGETFQALIGEEIDFPVKFLPCLTDAVVDKKVSILNDDGQPSGKYKEFKHKRFIVEKL